MANRLIYTFVLNFISVPNSNRIYKHNCRKTKLNACDCVNYLIEAAIGVKKKMKHPPNFKKKNNDKTFI